MKTTYRVIGWFADMTDQDIWFEEEYDLEAPARQSYDRLTYRDCEDLRGRACKYLTPDATLEQMDYNDEGDVEAVTVIEHELLMERE
jgi:hypothetical protein